MNAFYPDVPIANGVPPVLRDGVPSEATQLQSDTDDIEVSAPPTWGIYGADGAPLTIWDSFSAFEFREERRVANYPVEGGQFESYNKVAQPFEILATITRGGSETDRSTFLAEIESAVQSIEFFTIVTPEITYTPISLARYDYRRSSLNGVTLLTVDIACVQIRSEVTVTFTNTKAAASADRINNGPVSATAAPANVGAPK